MPTISHQNRGSSLRGQAPLPCPLPGYGEREKEGDINVAPTVREDGGNAGSATPPTEPSLRLGGGERRGLNGYGVSAIVDRGAGKLMVTRGRRRAGSGPEWHYDNDCKANNSMRLLSHLAG
jgi:hypothetical protein